MPLNTFLGRNLIDAYRQPLGAMLGLLVKGDLYYSNSIPTWGSCRWPRCFTPCCAGATPFPERGLPGHGAAVVFAGGMVQHVGLLLCAHDEEVPLHHRGLGLSAHLLAAAGRIRLRSASARFCAAEAAGHAWVVVPCFAAGSESSHAFAAGSDTGFSQTARWAILVLLACFGLDHLVNGSYKYFCSPNFVTTQGKDWPEVFVDQAASLSFDRKMFDLAQKLEEAGKIADPVEQARVFKELAGERQSLLEENRVLLTARYWIYGAVFGILWLLLSVSRHHAADASGWRGYVQELRWARWVGPGLLAVYLADVGFYFYQVMRQAPWCPPDMAAGDELKVADTIYRPQRFEGEVLPKDAARVLNLIRCPRGGVPYQGFYGSHCVLMQLGFTSQAWRVDLMMPAVKSMLRARPESYELFQVELPVEVVQRPSAFKRSIGFQLDKARHACATATYYLPMMRNRRLQNSRPCPIPTR